MRGQFQSVTVRNALTVYGTTAFTGAITLTSKAAVDSLTVVGESRLGGLVGYDQILSLKNNAVNSNILSLYNSRATLLVSADSSGKFNADSLTIDGNTRLGGLSAYGSRVSVKNDAVNATAFNVYNSRNTSLFSIDSSGAAVGTRGVLADTGAFSTTLASKAVYIAGVVPGSLFYVSKRVVEGTSTDTPADSCILSYMVKPDSLILLRQGTYAASGGSMPSGTKFSWFLIK